jgi:hypothetical protein
MSDISAISSTSASASAGESKQQKIAADLKALAAALTKNNTHAAQAAMKQLQIDSAGSSSSASSSSGGGSSSASSSSTSGAAEIARVATALNAGNLIAAKSAFASFQSNAAAAFKKKPASSDDAPDSSDAADLTQQTSQQVASKSKINVVV